jgi:hypothetical protein
MNSSLLSGILYGCNGSISARLPAIGHEVALLAMSCRIDDQ